MSKDIRRTLPFRPLCTLLLAVCLVACSTSFAYNRLDWLIVWYANDYVDLSREQKGFLKARLEPVLEWHRHEELLTCIDLLDRIEKDLAERHAPAD